MAEADSSPEKTTVNIRMTETFLEDVDVTWEEYGFNSRSEFIAPVGSVFRHGPRMSEPPIDGSESAKERLDAYLRRQVRNGNYYFKCKFIAEELDLSAHEIGSLMTDLRDSATDLEVQKWGNARATTWYVQHR